MWFNSCTEKSFRWHETNVRFGIYSFVAILSVILVSTIAYAAFSWKFKGSDLRMINLGKFQNVSCSQTIDDNVCVQGMIEFDENTMDRKWALLKMKTPTLPEKNQFIEAKRTFFVEKNKKYSFGVFVQQPYKRGDGRTGFFDIVISANDKQKKMHLEDTDEQRYILLENIRPIDDEITISFKIISNVDYNAASWQRASLTNFRFARLYPMNNEQKTNN